MLDIGGESTRPGAAPVAEAEEIARVVPADRGHPRRERHPDLHRHHEARRGPRRRRRRARRCGTTSPRCAVRPDSLATAAELGCEVVLMHMQGEPRDHAGRAALRRRGRPRWPPSWPARAEAAMAAGVARGAHLARSGHRLRQDPGPQPGPAGRTWTGIVALGFPVLLGVSRKSFIRASIRRRRDADDRLGGSLAVALAGARGRRGHGPGPRRARDRSGAAVGCDAAIAAGHG